MKTHVTSVIILVLLSTVLASAATLSVPSQYPTIQDGIDAAMDGDKVIVAPGIYTGNGNRDIDFKGKAITVKSESGPRNCIIDCNGSAIEPHCGFDIFNPNNLNVNVDGFTIRKGYAPSGIWHGGGILCFGSLTLKNCILRDNYAGQGGGGVYCYNSLTNDANFKIINCLIVGNSADHHGGGIDFYGGTMAVINCTISGNSAAIGSGITVNKSTTLIRNSIIWGNPYSYDYEIYEWNNVPQATVEYGNVRGGWAGSGNINKNPLFVDPNNCNYHLKPSSPCIDAAIDAGIYEDIEGNVRPWDYPGIDNNGSQPEFDMGAYEFVSTTLVACIAPINESIEAQGPYGAKVTLDGSCSSDADSSPGTNDDINDFNWYRLDPADSNNEIFLGSGQTIDCNLPLGTHTIVLEVTDKAGESDSNEITITIEDTTPPEFNLSVSPTILWPANHKMIKITPTFDVNDLCDPSPKVSLVDIVVNEPNNANDIQISDDGSIYLCATRTGNSEGRIYTITYQACDSSDNCTTRSCTVIVPHDHRK